jgi:uncharacterized membrane protein YjjP (DUF1212 family)
MASNNCSIEVAEKTLKLAYFLAPSVLFFSLIWLPWHFLHLVVEIGFLAPHLKHILKNNLRCCAICFFAASVIGIYYTSLNSKEGSFLPFCSYYFAGFYKAISHFLLLSYNCSCTADGTNIIEHF